MEEKRKLGILGADGRMGRAVISALTENMPLNLVAALTHAESPHLGQDIYDLLAIKGPQTKFTDNLSALKDCDVIIDFSAPEASLAMVESLQESNIRAIVSGTTGFTQRQQARFETACKDIVLLQSGNFSLGVNMLEALVALTADKLRSGWDIDVLEMHHKYKVDAPSGTALMLGEAAAKGRGVELSTVQRLSREGQTGVRPEGEIGFATLRGGGVIGEHSVMITSELEMLTLSHSAFDRSVFANGAVSAALWAVTQKPGKYDMKDVLGLSKMT